MQSMSGMAVHHCCLEHAFTPGKHAHRGAFNCLPAFIANLVVPQQGTAGCQYPI